MKQISIVIPAFNEEKFIGGLLKSLEKIDYPKDKFETVVVNDGSTDHTAEVVRSYPWVRLIELPMNLGRYKGRKKGAQAAIYPNILFVDARAVVDSKILSTLNQSDAKVVNGYSLGVETPTVFETFYLSIRRKVFHQFYKNIDRPFYLSSENFDSMPKGTTVLYVEKEVLFSAYEELSNIDMGKESSDDTKLLQTIVNRVPVLVHPGVKVINFARTSPSASITHLFGRGSKFVDYYLSFSQQKFWLVIFFPLLAILALLCSLIFIPISLLIKISILIGIDLLITAYLSKTFRDFYIILFMLPLCVSVFYLGIIRGIYLKCH